MNKVVEREWDHVLESARYGKLYQILTVHGNKAICARCTVRHGVLKRNNKERITVVRTPDSPLDMEPNDLVYRDNAKNPMWSLYKIKEV